MLRTRIEEELESVDWEALGPKLVVYAAHKIESRRWRTGSSLDIAKGQQAWDVVQEAIRRFLAGTRRWDPDRVSFRVFLNGVIDSLVDELAGSPDNGSQVRWPRSEVDDDELVDKLESGAEQRDQHQWLPRGPEQPAAQLERERREFEDQRVSDLFEAVDDQPELVEVLEAVMKVNDPKPGELAEALGVPVSDVKNRLKRLRRAVILETDDKVAKAVGAGESTT